MKTPFAVTAALVMGGLAGLTAGVTLPRAQAQAVAPPSVSELQQQTQLASLEQRVAALESQVKLLEQQRLADKIGTAYPLTPPPSFGPAQSPSDGSGMPHVRPPAYIWPAAK